MFTVNVMLTVYSMMVFRVRPGLTNRSWATARETGFSSRTGDSKQAKGLNTAGVNKAEELRYDWFGWGLR